MELRSSPRHSRRGLRQSVSAANLATALNNSKHKSNEIIDFSPGAQAEQGILTRTSSVSLIDSTEFLSFLADEIGKVAAELIDFRPSSFSRDGDLVGRNAPGEMKAASLPFKKTSAELAQALAP